MNVLRSKPLLVVCLGILLLTGGTASAADKDKYRRHDAVPTRADSIPSIAFLPRDVSKSLKITTVPTSRPVPLIVGTYWNCRENAQDVEICRIKIVVCTDDQSFCTQVN